MNMGTISMTLLKVGKVKALFHAAGIGRVSNKSIIGLGEAIESVISQIAKDAVVVYGKGQFESHDLEKLTDIKDYKIKVVAREPADLDIKELLREEEMPPGWDSDEIEEGEDGGRV